jgi:hypothetical protein
MRVVREEFTMSDQFNIDQFAAAINSRLSAEARIASAVGFGWQCGGYALGLGLASIGVLLGFYGYSFMLSSKPTAEYTAKAIAEAFQRAELHTSVNGILELNPKSEVSLAAGQTVQLSNAEPLKLDPASTVRVVGDLKLDIPQPSKQQLQLDAMTAAKDVPFTRYTVFKATSFGAGGVTTGWDFDLSDTTHPTRQRCYYRQTLGKGISTSQTLAFDGAPVNPSARAKLSFDYDGALANCIWFSGY